MINQFITWYKKQKPQSSEDIRNSKLLRNILLFILLSSLIGVPASAIAVGIPIADSPLLTPFLMTGFLPLILVYPFAITKHYRKTALILGIILIILGYFGITGIGEPGEERLFIYFVMMTLVNSIFLDLRIVTILWIAQVALIILALILHDHIVLGPDFIIAIESNIIFSPLIILFQRHVRKNNELHVNILRKLNQEIENEKLSLAEEKFKDEAILRNIEDGLIVVNHEGQIVSANPTVTKWTERDVLKGIRFENVIAILHDSNKEPFSIQHLLQKTLEQSHVSLDNAYIKARKSFHAKITFTAFASSNNEQNIIISIQDITQEQNLEEAKNNFIFTSSHELKTPLTGIISGLDFITSNKDIPIEEQNTILDQMKHAAQKLNDKVSRLLQVSEMLSKTYDVSKQTTDVPHLISTLVNHFSKELRSNVSIHYKEPKDPQIVEVNTNALRQILLEILSNASKFTSEGSIEISSAYVQNTNYQTEFLEISISDTGEGIDPETQKIIFNSFVQEGGTLHRKEEYGGFGIGLYYAKQLADQVGIDISFESKENTGTTFTIKIPI